MKANSTKQENTIRTGGKSISKQICGSEGAFIQYLSQDLALARVRQNQSKKGGLTKLLPPKVI
jgi:hypothetical protein